MRRVNVKVVRLEDKMIFFTQGIYLGFLAPHDFNFKAQFSIDRAGNTIGAGDVFDFGSSDNKGLPGFLVFIDFADTSQIATCLFPQLFSEGDEFDFTITDDKPVGAEDYKLMFARATVALTMKSEWDEIVKCKSGMELNHKLDEYRSAYEKAAAAHVISEGSIFRCQSFVKDKKEANQ